MLTPLSRADAGCGAKAATLGRLLRRGVAVPPGFVVEDALVDDGWQHQLEPALRALGGGPVVVRSSARGEDGADASFAGQLRSELGLMTPADVVGAVRRVAASGGGPAVTAYSARTGRALDRAVPVIVQRLVPAEAAGVLFTRHPVTGVDQVVVEATRGLGDHLAGGEVTPARWTVRGTDVAGAGNGEAPLTPAQVLAVAATGRRVADLLGCPQDVEWAIAGGAVHVLQARPITGAAAWASIRTAGSAMRAPTPGTATAARTALITGTAAGPGTAVGPVRVVRGLDDFARFEAGDVLVCRTTSPAWTPLLARAAAVVTEVGGLLAHAAIVAREFGIPAVVAADRATAVLRDGLTVLVDGADGTVSTVPGTAPVAVLAVPPTGASR
jgi:pyruvate,water dikinase